MPELDDDLNQRLVRAGLYSATSSGRSHSWGRAHSHAPQWACSSSQAQSPSLQASRWEGTTAPQQWGCITMHSQLSPVLRSHAEPRAPLYFPRGERWAPYHSLLNHGWGHRVDDLPQPSIVPTRVTHSEATSIKRPWERSMMRCSHSIHRWPHSMGRQQQQYQSPPKRGPMQGGVHCQTPSWGSLQACPTFDNPAMLPAWGWAVTSLFQLPSTTAISRIPRGRCSPDPARNCSDMHC